MAVFAAPLRDIKFVLQELIGFGRMGLDDAEELIDAILTGAAKLATDRLSPLNVTGDREGVKLSDDGVVMPPGFKEAYADFVAGGWNALACDPDFGGQGLPLVIAAPVEEIWNAANLSFALLPLLSRGAAEAIRLCGSLAQKSLYLPKLIEGLWTGAMDLTEPQAGSDLSTIRTKAVPDGDHYRISGQKIFISFGDHDLAENIIHLVLARTPDAPSGVKGVSLFLVPKYLVNADGSLGQRNDVHCISLEHKLGMHASPTCIMSFGNRGGAIGYLIGAENRGLEQMFIMMNAARFAVGTSAVAVSEGAYQHALDYARSRLQGTDIGTRDSVRVPIIRHPDVRRMLLSMRARIEAMRALVYTTAALRDDAGDPGAQAKADLLTPVIKGWCTESAIEITSTGIQIFGGMGYIEETGAAQYLRDCRVLSIYEGTTAIQANDLIGRKISRDGGEAARRLIEEMRDVAIDLRAIPKLARLSANLTRAVDALSGQIDFVVTSYKLDPARVSAGAVPLLHLFGITTGGWQMCRAALLACRQSESAFHLAKIQTAIFYGDTILSQADGWAQAARESAESVLTMDEAWFSLH